MKVGESPPRKVSTPFGHQYEALDTDNLEDLVRLREAFEALDADVTSIRHSELIFIIIFGKEIDRHQQL